MVKFSNGRHTYIGPGEWAQETEASARHQQGLRHREQQLGGDLERLALELAERKDALDNADFERALRQRALDARIQDEDADRAFRTRALDETTKARAADDARFDARDARDAQARDSMSRALGVLGGGSQPGTAPRNSVEAPSAPVYPPMDGRGPLKAQAPAMPDSDGDGTPDALETDDYDAETERMSGALTPFLKDIDPADQARIFGALEGRRAQGRTKLRAQQINAKAVKLAKNGLLDQTKLVDLQTALAQGADPEKVDSDLEDFIAASEHEFADGLQRESARLEATKAWEQMQALGLRLSPAARANVAALAARIANPLTSGKDAMKYAEDIRKSMFKDQIGETEKPWHEHPLIVKVAAEQGSKAAIAMARELGIQGVPQDPAPAMANSGGASGQAPTEPAGPDPEKVRRAAAAQSKLRDRYGREPTHAEIKAELVAEDGNVSREQRLDAQGERVAAQAANPKVVGFVPSAGDREFLKRTLGAMPTNDAEKTAALAKLDRLIDDSSGGYREKFQRAREILANEQIVKDEPGRLSEGEARALRKKDPRLQFTKRKQGGYDVVASNDVSRSSDRKGSTVNQ